MPVELLRDPGSAKGTSCVGGEDREDEGAHGRSSDVLREEVGDDSSGDGALSRSTHTGRQPLSKRQQGCLFSHLDAGHGSLEKSGQDDRDDVGRQRLGEEEEEDQAGEDDEHGSSTEGLCARQHKGCEQRVGSM